MHDAVRAAWIEVHKLLWRYAARPVLFRFDAQRAHDTLINALERLDHFPAVFRAMHRLSFPVSPVRVGGVMLESPVMLSAGFVKGRGFDSETKALDAVVRGVNIIPGWACVPALVGAVEIGSFTRWPRAGNSGRVMWRDASTRSTQNRIGLRNPGAEAGALFLSQRPLPPIFGVNIAVSPGVTDPDQERREAVEAFSAFVRRGVRPSWYTLNISCPNTEDDPGAHQTASKTRKLCESIRETIGDTPLWVKVSPDLADEQYHALLRVFAESGVRAVVATNTIGQPTPEDTSITAGVGGGRLHPHAVRVAALLAAEIKRQGYALDVIGCGGVENAVTAYDFMSQGAKAVQYYSAMVYEGLWAGAIIAQELRRN